MAKKVRPTTECAGCGCTVHMDVRQQALYKAGKPVCCGQTCRLKVLRASKPRFEVLNCAHCGKEFAPTDWQQRRTRAGIYVFCTQSCAASFQQAERRRNKLPKVTPMPKVVPITCPWASGSMPAHMRALPVW